MMVLKLYSLEQTKELARKLLAVARPGDVITLKGDLGAGKSEFARAFVKAAAGEETVVPSPTFTILEQYQTPLGLISHFDLYRIEHVDEIVELGFDEALTGSIALIEWPERLEGYPLSNLLQLEIAADPDSEVRTVVVHADKSWVERIDGIPR